MARRTPPVPRPTLFLGAVCVLQLLRVASSLGGVQVTYPCGEGGEFFDTSGLVCTACGENEVVSADGLSCECTAGHIQVLSEDPVASPGTGFWGCKSCLTLGKVPSADGRSCMGCGLNATLDNATSTCICDDDTWVLVEQDATGAPLEDKTCVPCRNGTYKDPEDPGRCNRCPRVPGTLDTFFVWDAAEGHCMCPAEADLPEGVECTAAHEMAALVQKVYGVSLTTLGEVYYYEPSTGGSPISFTTSYLLQDGLVPAAFACHLRGTRESCNFVANLCVLQHYDEDSAACVMYKALADSRKTLGTYHDDELQMNMDWMFSMPWLTYEDAASTFTTRKDVEMEVSFARRPYSSSTVSHLVYVLSAYDMNGTWLGFHNLTGTTFQACGGRWDQVQKWMRFGNNYENKCHLQMSDVKAKVAELGMERLTFYDLYLQDLGGDLDVKAFPAGLYPVPVINKSVRRSGLPVNDDSETLNDLLVRRFFFFDDESSREVDAVTGEPGEPQGFRIASKFTLTTEIRKDEERRIYPPVLTIEYSDRVFASTLEEFLRIEIIFSANFTMKLGDYRTTWVNLMVAALVLSALYWMYEMYCFMRRRQNQQLDWEALIFGVFAAAGSVGNLFFIQAAAVAFYWFIFYKLQSSVFIMAPPNDRTNEFNEWVMVACIMQVAHVAHLVYRQCNIDIFFVDWDRPRWADMPSEKGVGKKDHPKISCWRTLFVANEWNELQTERVASLEMTLVAMLLLLYGVQLGGLGDYTPDAGDNEDTPFRTHSTILRFALIAGLFIMLSAVQVLYKVLYHHRYVANPLEQLVDLLAVANVSIVILQDKYAGHYIHGRSALPHADTTLMDLTEQFRAEELGQTAHRGLIQSGDSDEIKNNQCFEIFIDDKLRKKYDDKLMRLVEDTRRKARESQSITMLSNLSKPTAAPKQQVEAAEKVMEVFKSFLDEVEQDPKKHVREKIFQERFLSFPPDMDTVQHSVFFHDFQHSFAKYMFYGIELQLLLANILVFCCVDASTYNFALSAFVCYLFEMVLRHYRHQLGENNLSEKTLVDSRFLI